MATGNFRDIRTFASDIPSAATSHGRKWPQGHEEWQGEYRRRLDAYLGLPYDTGDVKALHLFRALDPNGDIIDMTRRLTKDVQHICDTDTNALLGESWSLEPNPTLEEAAADRWMAAATEVWERSRVAAHRERWSRNFAVMGVGFLEAVRTEAGAMLVAHASPHVDVEFDGLNVDLERVTIRIDTFKSSDLDDRTGEPTGGERDDLSTYVRELTKDRIRVWRDGKLVPEESGPNPLGVIPGVHVVFTPVGEPEHGLGAAAGLDDCMSLVHSLLTQMSAIGNRHANPIIAAKGFKLGGDSTRIGRTINGIPLDGDLQIHEATLSGVTALLATAAAHHQMLRATLPEFMLDEAAAGSSGEALRIRATPFVSKMRPIRARWLGAVAEGMAMCVAMDENRRLMPGDRMALRVQAGPILPLDIEAELARVLVVRQERGMLEVDFIRHLQRLDIIDPAYDPEEYSGLVSDEIANADARMVGQMEMAQETVDKLTGAEIAQREARREGNREGDDTPLSLAGATDTEQAASTAVAAEVALNGAQIASALEIVDRVANRNLPRAEGVVMLMEFFGLDKATAERIMGTVGRGFFIAEDPPPSA